ncbi:outer membrane channel protein TolC [Thalassotalea sp. PLHSN55]|uniref:outer membrane channel protein TolC n=1 Tax=Thalassotalea sp. PLHSN55 TaxID=3435888 RepID=UPI003F832D07
MKKTLTALIIGFACTANLTSAYADDLSSVYQQAKTADPVVLKAQAQFMASESGIDIARSTLLPQISANAGLSKSSSDSMFTDNAGNRLKVNSDVDNINYGLSLSMQVYHHDTWLTLANAEKAAHRSDVAYQVAKQDLIIRVTEAYFAVLSAKDDLEFSTAEKVAIERQLEQTKQRYAVGLTAITDVHEAQAQYDTAVTSEIRAENSVYNAEEALRVITNVYPRDLNVLNTARFSTTLPVPNSANEWQQKAEAKSLDLIGQKISMDIAKENINIARAGHLPTVDLTSSYSSSENTIDTGMVTFDDPYLDNFSVGLSVTVPLYNGGAITSAVEQAQNNYVAASQDLSLTHRDVVRTARNSYNNVIATISGIKALEQSVVSAEAALQATEAGFEVGTRTIVDVLDSTRNLYNAKRNLASTRYSYISGVLSLKRAAGTISEQDIEDINQGLIPSN